MSIKKYEWEDGAVLAEHSKKKHQILREYFYEYVITRCKLPKRDRFRLAVVDGFAGGGRYKCGAPGSPIIFIEELNRSTKAINIHRAEQNLPLINIECLLILNDNSKPVVELLKQNLTPVLMESIQSNDHLTIRVEYLNTEFEKAYPEIKALLQRYRIANVVFNLDQCGHSHVAKETLVDIMSSYTSAEVFYTFMIDSLLAFLQRDNPQALEGTLAYLSLSRYDLDALNELMHKKRWLGAAEKIVFTNFQRCAQYVSPFSINNPGGWRYWLIHLANSYRARQVYNNVLHDNSKSQAHCGRSGLNMLAHDPEEEKKLTLYLFDSSAREEAKGQLLEDIPRVVSEFGDALNMGDFYNRIYNHTPAHSDDIHIAMLENPDIEVITKAGGTRRKPGQINIFDTIKLKSQRSFSFPLSIKK